MSNWLIWSVVGLVGLIALLELGLRLLGFGNPLLYWADPQIGYLIAPSQQTRRLGKQITINQFSMRSPEIAVTRPAQTLRVLMIGDSIVNGGWWTDQTKTLSALLQQQLKDPGYTAIEVLNASANSWSPRNELAYLQRFGSFESQIIVLVINTDDLFGTAPASVVVGRDCNYPDRKPPTALAEVLSRYVFKPRLIPELAAIQAEPGDRVGANLAAIRQVQELAQQNQARFILLMTPLLRELGQPGPHDYEVKARQRLHAFTLTAEIAYIDFLPVFNALPHPQTLYHDSIHLNLAGNQQVVAKLLEKI